MLERRQLPSLDLVNDTLDSSFGSYIGFDGGDAVFRSNVFEQLVRAGLVSNDGEDVAFCSESAMDSCDADVACGSYYEDGLHDLGHRIQYSRVFQKEQDSLLRSFARYIHFRVFFLLGFRP